MKIIGLIPSRIGSKRLPAKALLPINNLPLIVHVYKRAKLSKKLTDVIVCCDDQKIYNVRVKAINALGVSSTYTSANHTVIGATDTPADVSTLSVSTASNE